MSIEVEERPARDPMEGLAGRLVLPAEAYRRDRRPWLAERRKGIGASDIAGIMGLSPYASATPYAIWEEKTAEEEPEDKQSEAAFWGHKHEHNVATVFAARNPQLGKIAPTPGLIAHEELDHVRATLDRLLVKRRSKERVIVAGVECKTVGERIYEYAWIDGVPPIQIQLQAQQQMAVTGLPLVYVPHLVGGNNMPEPYVAERDESVIDAILTFADDWWQKHVVGGQPPEPTLADFERMSDIFPARPPGASIRLTPALEKLLADHLDAKRREKEAGEDKTLAAFEIQKTMRDAEEIRDEKNQVLATWKRPKQSYLPDGRAKKSSRTFLTKEPKI